ncbi:MAG: MCE family protein [Actinomadura sp.]
MKPATILRLGVVIVAVAMIGGAVAVLWPGSEQRRVTAYFTSAVGLYPGADVRILGIKVGKVDSVTPVGRSVKVELNYDGEQKVPADAQAMIVSQTLVADRYIQLTPVYKGGPVLADGVTMPLTRTAVPVEIDEVSGSLNDLNKALGPEGANATGSLSRLLQVGATTLDGQGDDLRQTISDTSRLLSTLSEDRGDVAATIENLRQITAVMVANDQQIRRFNQDLASVSTQLADEKEELGAALRTLGPTLRNVNRFVKGNRSELAANVRQLAQITSVLVKNKKFLADFLTTSPTGLSNLAHAYDPISGSLGTRADIRQFSSLGDWVCSLAFSLGTPADQCGKLLDPLNTGPTPAPLSSLSLDLSWITALTTHYDPVPPPPDAFGPGASGGSGNQGASSQSQGGSAPSSNQGLGALLPGGTS